MSEELTALAENIGSLALKFVANGINRRMLNNAASAIRRLAAAGEQKPVAYVPLSQCPGDEGNPIWRETRPFGSRNPWAGYKCVDLYTAPQPAQSTSDAGGGVLETPLQRAERVGNKIFYSGTHAASLYAINAIAKEIEDAVALSTPAAADSNTSAAKSTIVTCCVTGAIPGDGGACGDCDPCLMGEASVPDPVKRLIAEKNSLIERNAELEEAANASAEARLREDSMVGLTDLERTLLIAAKAAQNYIANTESELGMTLKSGDLLRAAIAKSEACVFSSTPNASDCEKQGETTKSEGGEPDAERTQRRLAVSDDGLGPMQAIPREPPSGPSDRTADVTEDDLVRVIKTVNVDFGGWEPDLARALRDAFDMRRR